jgi:ribosomal protein S18 acetylase RimI-like enzyme
MSTSTRKPMRLHVLVLNRALEFYKRHGFIETGRSDIYIDMERTGQLTPVDSGGGQPWK